jgi:Skp family chaperone for outer membrane proteins
MTPGSLESASLTTWTTQLTAVESHATERDKFANDLVVQVAEPLKQAAAQYEELRKCHVDFHAKLEKERDSSYHDLKKMKGKYDGACQEVETRRKKMESSFDHSKPKAQAAYQQQILEMNNVKNTYLISINVTNKMKERFYHEYVPELLDVGIFFRGISS